MSEQLFDLPVATRSSDDYWTPKWIFDALGLIFDLDVACPPGGPAHTPCKAFYTPADDGLTQPWHGLVWMNPPYSQCTPWVDKFMKHGNGLALLPMAKSMWFNRLWQDCPALCITPSGMKFEQGSISSHTVLAAYGETAIYAIRKMGKVR